MGKFRHVNGTIKVVDDNLNHIFENSPSWRKYEEKKPETTLTKKQLKELNQKKGNTTQNKSEEELVEQIKVEDPTIVEDFTDKIV